MSFQDLCIGGFKGYTNGDLFFVFQGVWVFLDKCNAGASTNLSVYYSTLGIFFHEQISPKSHHLCMLLVKGIVL